ncbi:MAG TPA: hypothetical protein VM422_00780 [Amaricoccus sp.]|nr:hypothetical protein [Amaricoccus sp.]
MNARSCVALLAAAVALAACAGAPSTTVPAAAVVMEPAPEAARATATVPVPMVAAPAPDPALVAMYASRQDGARTLPAIDVAAFHRALLRNEVDYPTAEAPGTVVIDTTGPFLYLVEGEGRATRYGIAVGH